MVSVFVDGKVLNWSVVPVQIRECTQSKRVPHDDVPFLSTTSNESVLRGVNERVHSFLMQVEGLVLFVRKILYVVDVYEPIKGSWYDIVEVWVELDLCNPTFVDLLFNDCETMFLLLVRYRLLLLKSDGVLISFRGLTIFPLASGDHWLILDFLVLGFLVCFLYLFVELFLDLVLVTLVLVLGS